jgi:hypothetical protein
MNQQAYFTQLFGLLIVSAYPLADAFGTMPGGIVLDFGSICKRNAFSVKAEFQTNSETEKAFVCQLSLKMKNFSSIYWI